MDLDFSTDTGDPGPSYRSSRFRLRRAICMPVVLLWWIEMTLEEPYQTPREEGYDHCEKIRYLDR